MNFDLAAILPVLLPKAIAWAEQRSAEILASGIPLDEQSQLVALRVGVVNPEMVRVLFVAQLPLPSDPALRQAALQAGLLGPGIVGLTLGYGIYICNGHGDQRLLAHECRHVYQYEQVGSIAKYLPEYLGQVAQFGYTGAPYEVDARAHETDA